MGRFLIDRSIFEKSFWADIPTFRLFFLLIGKAAYEDGVQIGPVTLKRGQWIRSFRKLQEDLVYFEDGVQKHYSTKTIKRCVDILREQQRLETEECSFGTLFTLVNYEQYQEFSGTTTSNVETLRKQRGNSMETIRTKQTKQTKYPPTPQGGESLFDEFWKVYPKKVGKAAVKRHWERHNLDKVADDIIAAVKRYKTTETWQKDNFKFVPNPQTFLNQERWEDEITPVMGQTTTQTRAQAMVEAWGQGKSFRLKASGDIVKAAMMEPVDHRATDWRALNLKTPTGFKSKRTGSHAFFTEFEILED